MIKLNENGQLYKLFQLWEDEWETKGDEIVWDNPKHKILKRSHPKFKDKPYALIDKKTNVIHGTSSDIQPLLKLSKTVKENDII